MDFQFFETVWTGSPSSRMNKTAYRLNSCVNGPCFIVIPPTNSLNLVSTFVYSLKGEEHSCSSPLFWFVIISELL